MKQRGQRKPTLREASTEATVVATGIGPKTNIDAVLGGGDGVRKTGATHTGKQRRRYGWTIMDLQRQTYGFRKVMWL